MKKLIKSKNIQQIPPSWIPYKNWWENWCWAKPNDEHDLSCPGIKAPSWAKQPMNENCLWYWSD